MSIPVIDLFAGPGGLGEGFSSFLDEDGNRKFDIKLSIEKDKHAHETLRLRSFLRLFKNDDIPELYYTYVKENNPKNQKKILEQIKLDYPTEWTEAENEAWLFELPFELEVKRKGGKTYTIGYTPEQIEERHQIIDERITASLSGQLNFVLIGGPPCQAFSLVGRSRNKGISNKDHRIHLYKEYLRIIAKHHPAVFVMENVKGLLSSEVKGEKVFDLMKSDLKNPQSIFPDIPCPKYKLYSFVNKPDGIDENGFPYYYDDRKFLIKAEKYSIPQKRHRVILLGIREDISCSDFPTLEKHSEIVLKSIIQNLAVLRSGINRKIVGKNEKMNNIYQSIDNTQSNWEIAILKALEKLQKVFPKRDLKWILDFPKTQGANYIEFDLNEIDNPLYEKWYKDERLGGIINHETRMHLEEDLCRYLFSAIWLKEKGNFPKLRDYPEWLLPEHKNAKEEKFADRFRTQKPKEPATTITSHISKDGHYFIHYDPKQCRSLTVREAARVQTFPDNYLFCGPRTQQYHQVGNAVPPYLAFQIAGIVLKVFK
jgi:DNA (cytosine-5)-methyltransferase 1